MRTGIDRDACSGYGMCEATAPDYFTLDDDGLGSTTDRPVEPADLALLREAVLGCPANAVWLNEATDDVPDAA